MKLTVVGLGLIGGSMALDLKAKKFAQEVIGVDASREHAHIALENKIVDRVLDLEEASREADCVILAVPVNQICKLLPQVLNYLQAHAVVTDVGSTKEIIVESVKTHVNSKQFVPSHPMAGTENSGPQAAIRELFIEKTAVICNVKPSENEWVSRVEALYKALGMRCIYMGSKEHDMHAAFVSHLSHISSFVLANTVLDIEQNVSTIFDLAGGGFESTVRLAKSSPEMWLPIFEQNHVHVVEALEAYITHLQKFHQSLVEKKWDVTREFLAKANEIRRVLENMSAKKVSLSK